MLVVACQRDRRGINLLCPRPEPPGVEHATYRFKGYAPEHGNSHAPARHGDGLPEETGNGCEGGRSLRSSPSAGKPRTWRRETERRCASEVGATVCGHGPKGR